MHQLEIELKWALDAVGHAVLSERLAAAHGPAHRLIQNNRFYDSADLRLRRRFMNLRLRHENGRLVMTCKRKQGGSGNAGLHTHDEWEEEVDAALADAPVAALAAALPLPEPIREALDGAALVCAGGFANARLEWRVGPDLLCLDATDFGARTDYELEIETADAAPAAMRWQAALAAWGVTWRPEPRTKFARFLALGG